MVKEKKELVFRGKLIDYGYFKNHLLQQVPFDDNAFPPDYSLSYESFLYYFGGGLVYCYCLPLLNHLLFCSISARGSRILQPLLESFYFAKFIFIWIKNEGKID
jgi:hypothetical protein